MNKKSILKTIAIGVSAMLFIGNSTANITEESLKDYLAKSIKASTILNIDFLINTIAEEAKILASPSCSYPTKDVIIMSKKEYIGSTKLIKSMLEDFHYEIRKLSKNISSDKITASIITDSYQKITLGGQSVISKSQEVIELQEIENKIKIIKVSACGVNGDYPGHRYDRNISEDSKLEESNIKETKVENTSTSTETWGEDSDGTFSKEFVENESTHINLKEQDELINANSSRGTVGVIHTITETKGANTHTINKKTKHMDSEVRTGKAPDVTLELLSDTINREDLDELNKIFRNWKK